MENWILHGVLNAGVSFITEFLKGVATLIELAEDEWFSAKHFKAVGSLGNIAAERADVNLDRMEV